MKILTYLQKVRKVGEGRYNALCPVHGDKNPSLGVTIRDDQSIVMNCLSCGANGVAVCNALGIEIQELFPPHKRFSKYQKQTAIGFSAEQILAALEKESLVVLIAANKILKNEPLTQDDVDYLAKVVVVISEATNFNERFRK